MPRFSPNRFAIFTNAASSVLISAPLVAFMFAIRVCRSRTSCAAKTLSTPPADFALARASARRSTRAAFDTLRPRRFGVLTAERYRSTVADIVRPSARACLWDALSVRCAGRFVAFLVVDFLTGLVATRFTAFFVGGIQDPLHR